MWSNEWFGTEHSYVLLWISKRHIGSADQIPLITQLPGLHVLLLLLCSIANDGHGLRPQFNTVSPGRVLFLRSIQCCLKEREKYNASPEVHSFPRYFSSCFRSQYLLKAVSKGATTLQHLRWDYLTELCWKINYNLLNLRYCLIEISTPICQVVARYHFWPFPQEFAQVFGSLKAAVPTGMDHLPVGPYLY